MLNIHIYSRNKQTVTSEPYEALHLNLEDDEWTQNVVFVADIMRHLQIRNLTLLGK